LYIVSCVSTRWVNTTEGGKERRARKERRQGEARDGGDIWARERKRTENDRGSVK